MLYLLRLNFKFRYFPGGGGWVRVENKAKLSPAGAGAWAELGKMKNGDFNFVRLIQYF